MKKIIVLLVSLMLFIFIVGCTNVTKTSDVPESTQDVPESTQDEFDEDVWEFDELEIEDFEDFEDLGDFEI